MNRVVLIGRMVADPEMKYTTSGVAVCSFRIAVDRRYKSPSGEKEADFIDIVAWRQSAEFAAQYLTKGRLVAVQGKMQTRSWVQQDGQKRYKTEVVADQLQGLDRPGQAGQAPGGQSSAEPVPEPPMEAYESGADYDPFTDD